ncbi:hypothetical protein EX895_003095 [Sporisorium graminicola]|uniref:Uncharacterized protein n=1 Tax=Sporisorium graminicola TaxID=280036 RepID=A0A4V6ETV1_9BASI|nr:hypothetical protein EX895_003095 [Sporisorium graminicola]TKY87999.1 hypothetical protein EX895_003095 [Sporisorium graminicola]
MTVATRPRSPTPPTPRFENFRPMRYQTKEELDRFFGTTGAQRREQRLRVRESDGQVYFDWIEKDEWQHLLATGSLTSPSSPEAEAKMDRRRSSGMTCLTLASPLAEACVVGSSQARRASSARGVSPLSGRFERVQIGIEKGAEGEGEGEERRGRKRSNSVLAARSARVYDRVLLDSLDAGDGATWTGAAGFKRRQSAGFAYSPRTSFCSANDDTDRIRIARLPLSRRRLDQESLDQAFSPARSHKPPTLQIPDIIQGRTSLDLDDLDDDAASGTTCPADSTSLLHAPTFDGSTSGTRRGTFGSFLPPCLPPRHLTPPPSSAMEFLVSPTPTDLFAEQQRQPAILQQQPRLLRHATTFETPKSSGAPWGVRQRWHSAEAPLGSAAPPSGGGKKEERRPGVRNQAATWRGAAVAAEVEMNTKRRVSTSSDGSSASETCYTPLAPRVGAKRFDKTRMLHLVDPTAPSPVLSRSDTVPMREPVQLPTATATMRGSTSGGLRTGAEVYLGIDIPCASIHLHSDPEDNVEPALALSLSARELRRLKKKPLSLSTPHAPTDSAEAAERGRPSVAASATAAHVKGSSKWWSHILHA